MKTHTVIQLDTIKPISKHQMEYDGFEFDFYEQFGVWPLISYSSENTETDPYIKIYAIVDDESEWDEMMAFVFGYWM